MGHRVDEPVTIPDRARTSRKSSALDFPFLSGLGGGDVASIGETAGVCLEVIGGDGAREGSKEGARRGVRVEDANECRNKTDSYLRDRTGYTYFQ
jgi:hypothetical protein